MKLLTTSQYKLNLGQKEQVYTAGLNLSPHDEASKILCRPDLPSVCPMAGTCAQVCLKNTGLNQMNKNALVRANKTAMLFDQPEQFHAQVLEELDSAQRTAAKKSFMFAYRPNLLSDLPKLATKALNTFKNIMVYDYTKLPKPWLRARPNYHLTMSWSEKMGSDDIAECLDHGINVAMVLDVPRKSEMPKFLAIEGDTYPVIDGDQHDLRFRDPRNVIVGLRFKGSHTRRREGIAGGFVWQP